MPRLEASVQGRALSSSAPPKNRAAGEWSACSLVFKCENRLSFDDLDALDRAVLGRFLAGVFRTGGHRFDLDLAHVIGHLEDFGTGFHAFLTGCAEIFVNPYLHQAFSLAVFICLIRINRPFVQSAHQRRIQIFVSNS
jgi:hypothetical protein